MKNTSLNRLLLLTVLIIFPVIMLLLFSFVGDTGNKGDGGASSGIERLQSVIPPELPDKIDFAGENVPMDLFYVRESFDRELLINTYWHSSTILMLKRANRWFPVIEPILKKNNVPDDFKYLALIESGFTGVVSPKGAAGYWQFLEKTARDYGLEVNEYVDERYHVEKATEAACSYLLDSYETYKNWTLVAAAYNAGNRRITESLEEQKAERYYDLYLNEETSRYIYRILAIKSLYKAPEKYGFFLTKDALYPPLKYTSIPVDQSIEDLVGFADEQGMSYRLLKEFNPWLKARSLPNSSGKHYEIKIISGD